MHKSMKLMVVIHYHEYNSDIMNAHPFQVVYIDVQSISEWDYFILM